MVVNNHPGPRNFLRGLSRVMEVLDKRDGTPVTLRLSTEFSLLLHDPGEDDKKKSSERSSSLHERTYSYFLSAFFKPSPALNFGTVTCGI